MIGIEEISKYRTSDGVEFTYEEDAMNHEIELAIKNIQPGDIIMKDRFGQEIELKDLWWKISGVYYVEIKSEAALDFFNEASHAEGMLPLEQGLGIYRYDECSDLWTTPQDDVQKLWEQWSTYNEELKFTVS
jgi:hypothetical protein